MRDKSHHYSKNLSSFLNEPQFLINEVNADIAKEKHTLSLLRLKYGFDREKSSIGGSYIELEVEDEVLPRLLAQFTVVL